MAATVPNEGMTNISSSSVEDLPIELVRRGPVSAATDCLHVKYYCEENVWKLCEQVKTNRPEELNSCYAVFISNKDRIVPIWQQKIQKSEDPVVWDYHVIFLWKNGLNTYVYDLDSCLPFPCKFEIYLKEAIKQDSLLQPEYYSPYFGSTSVTQININLRKAGWHNSRNDSLNMNSGNNDNATFQKFRQKYGSWFHKADFYVYLRAVYFRVVEAATYLKYFASNRKHMLDESGMWKSKPPPYPCIRTEETDDNIQEFINVDASIGYGQVLNLKDFTKTFSQRLK